MESITNAEPGIVYIFVIIFLAYYAYEMMITSWIAGKHNQYPLIGLGKWTSLTPRFVLSLLFAGNVAQTLENGYQKFRTKAFQLIRNEGPVIVLPKTLLEELSQLPAHIASPHEGLEHDVMGDYTGINLILESRMHHSIVQRKLTPRMGLLTPGLEEQLQKAVDEYFPNCADEWTEFMPYQVFGKISARLAARVLVGPALCENKTWLDVTVNFTESIFTTVVILRFVPAWMRPVLCWCLPSYWAGNAYMRQGKKLLSPIIEDLLERNDTGKWTPKANEEESNVMCWLAETAKGKDRDADKLAHVEVLLALASVHTTLLRMVNVLFDITSDPEYFDMLNKEIETAQTNNSNGGYPYNRLDKLDSFMRESQRMSPPTTLGLRRMFKEPYTFSNGMRIAKGTYVCMATYAIENDIAEPDKFDGLRNYRKRQLQAMDGNGDVDGEKPIVRKVNDENLFSSVTPQALNFGYGKAACPGRFFASLIIKMLFVKLLPEYEFKFMPGTQRPRNFMVHEFLFCWPWQKMLVRRRKDGVSPLAATH